MTSSSSSSGPPHATAHWFVSNFSREKRHWESYVGGGEKKIPKSLFILRSLCKNE